MAKDDSLILPDITKPADNGEPVKSVGFFDIKTVKYDLLSRQKEFKCLETL